MAVKKKLIEVGLPLDAINKASAREKSIQHGHSSILAMVEFQPDGSHRVVYLRRPFRREPDFGVTSVNYDFGELLERAGPPA